LTCSLSGSGGDLRAESNLYRGAVHGSYDLAIYGDTSAGSFCCLYHDPDRQVSTIDLFGTGGADEFYLEGAGTQLEEYGQASLEVEVRGYGGPDIIRGSSETSLAYSEYLRGYNGHDVIEGAAGNDRIGGGFGADVLSGGGGTDVLYSGQDNVIDVLNGGYGFSFLCANQPRDQLLGANAVDSTSATQMYVSQGSTVPFHPGTSANASTSACGHTSYGTSWGSCDFYTLTQAPTPCADLGLAD
jgi:Ca2+-binding RTX toxin-like protein